ncbi:MAG: DsrE family protein [Candidatus Omnitrophica bacterium]|nr:DsrE family protein [Candidatus Omnitrophota bacterium]
MKRFTMAVLLAALMTTSYFPNAFAESGKYLIIFQAGKESHEGMARAVHALLYSKELKEHGHEVVLVFDGAGTEWVSEWLDPESQDKLKPVYEELRKAGITEVICDYCASAFLVKDKLKERKASLVAEYRGHPSIAKWADQGYQLVVL